MWNDKSTISVCDSVGSAIAWPANMAFTPHIEHSERRTIPVSGAPIIMRVVVETSFGAYRVFCGMKITLLILDVDGVLTSGGIAFLPDGDDAKTFHVQDGCAIKLWQRSGGVAAILSGRRSATVEERAKELGIELIETGLADKLDGYQRIVTRAGVADEAVCVVGDDLPDLPPMQRAGLSIAVANAVPGVKRAADYVTRRAGGMGAVAEVVEHLLRLDGRWTSDPAT